ncbi:MAG: VanZ family protein [Candidatus Woesebacteria bacterium]|jgi:VanZ family protein
MKVFLQSTKTYLTAFLPSMLWALLIFFLSNREILPGFSISLLDFLFKKLAHIFVYAILYLLLFQGLIKIKIKESKPKLYLLPLFICFLYALSDEFHQSLVAGRTANLRDVAYDMLGSSIIMLNKLDYI